MDIIEIINQRLKSIKLCLQAHPDNEPNSEFEDRIQDIEDLKSLVYEYGKQVAIEQREACIDELKTKGISFNTNHALNIISLTKLVVD